ncbi:MAG TPA: hypothetical protein VJ644_00785 [Jiangellaceae bacterium]|nr:hypothetical protein [Jiangellaceae bacterium]
MPLTDQDWTLVRCLVVDHLVATANPYAVLQDYFPDHVDLWPVTQVASENADTVVSAAKSASLADPSPLSIQLLEVLSKLDTIKVLPDIDKVTAYLQRLRAEKAALVQDDPFSACILPGSGEVFIDRVPLRASVRLLVDPPDGIPEPLVLRVSGERSTGKSYTFSLLQHLSDRCGIQPAKVIVGKTSTAGDVLRDFAVRVAAPGARPDPVDDPAKRLRYWALWLVEQARRSSPTRPWWFVIDQCNDLEPTSEVVELIAQLAIAIAEVTPHPAERRPRLVLLGYGDDFADLPVPRKQVHPDQVRRASEADVRTFFAQYFREAAKRSQGSETVDETALGQHVAIAAEQVLREAAEAEQAGRSYMLALARAAEGAVDVFAA